MPERVVKPRAFEAFDDELRAFEVGIRQLFVDDLAPLSSGSLSNFCARRRCARLPHHRISDKRCRQQLIRTRTLALDACHDLIRIRFGSGSRAIVSTKRLTHIAFDAFQYLKEKFCAAIGIAHEVIRIARHRLCFVGCELHQSYAAVM